MNIDALLEKAKTGFGLLDKKGLEWQLITALESTQAEVEKLRSDNKLLETVSDNFKKGIANDKQEIDSLTKENERLRTELALWEEDLEDVENAQDFIKRAADELRSNGAENLLGCIDSLTSKLAESEAKVKELEKAVERDPECGDL